MPEFRVATDADIESLFQCDVYSQSHPSRRLELLQWVKAGACSIAQVRGKVVGFMVLECHFFGSGFLSLVCVAAAHRGAGYGYQLLRYAEHRCLTEKLFTSTNESNVVARRLFERAGFVLSGSIKHLDEDDPELVYFKRVTPCGS